MAMEIMSSNGSFAAQLMAENGSVNGAGRQPGTSDAKKTQSQKAGSTMEKEEFKASNPAGKAAQKKAAGVTKNGRESSAAYAAKLAKLVPSVDFRVGSGFAGGQTGKTLTVHPAILEKMQNDPEQEKETTELIKGVESMTRLMKSIYEGSGWTVVFKHSYIDENGKYRSVALIRNDFGYKMSDRLREERKKNTERFMERAKENSAKKKEEIQKKLDEKSEKKAQVRDEATKLFEEKIRISENGMIYLYDTDLRAVMEAEKEGSGERDTKKEAQAGANLDLHI